LREDRTGIEARVHSHDRYASLAIAFEKRALNGRRATPAWQERGVNVQGAVRSDIENRWRQKDAVSDRDHNIGACGAYAFRRLGRLQGFGLEDFQAVRSGEALDRARGGLLTAPRRAIRLAENERDVMTGSVQRR